jgi:hypothetical protein
VIEARQVIRRKPLGYAWMRKRPMNSADGEHHRASATRRRATDGAHRQHRLDRGMEMYLKLNADQISLMTGNAQ